MIVGAAGIVVELLLASLALFLWLAAEPGWVRDLAFNVMLIGGVSSLFFNGNPLLRFDGYYVLADALDIPNLATRSRRYLIYLVQRHLFGLRDGSTPVQAPGESGWLLSYAVGSFLYRLLILFAIALFVSSEFPVAGVVLATWGVGVQLILPIL
jgi:putative peptide zinc metalloprotease protein